MWLNAFVLVETPEIDESQQESLRAAMGRRGWECAGRGGWIASFAHVESDEKVVQLIEQDVKQAAYVAGVSEYDSFCMVSEKPILEELQREFGAQPRG